MENEENLSGLEKQQDTSTEVVDETNSQNSENSEATNENNGEDVQQQSNEENVIPESYDFKDVSLPDGMELDSELTDEFSKVAKEMGLSQSNANKFMDLGVKLSGKLQDKFQNAMKEYRENQISSYQTMLNTDPEIGGAKLKETLIEANEAYEVFVSDEAAQLLADSGLNKHPAIVKVFRDIGKQLKNDSISNAGKKPTQRTAEDWFPDMKQE